MEACFLEWRDVMCSQQRHVGGSKPSGRALSLQLPISCSMAAVYVHFPLWGCLYPGANLLRGAGV